MIVPPFPTPHTDDINVPLHPTGEGEAGSGGAAGNPPPPAKSPAAGVVGVAVGGRRPSAAAEGRVFESFATLPWVRAAKEEAVSDRELNSIQLNADWITFI